MSATLERAIRHTASRLSGAGIPDAEAEAERLARMVLAAAPARGAEDLDTTIARIAELAEQRSARVPLGRLLGAVRFRSIELLVGDGVFVPQPETEPLVEWCVDHLRAEPSPAPLVVDLCTGSGTVALAIANELPEASVHAVELSPEAIVWTRRNAERRAAAGDTPVQVHLGDAAEALPGFDGRLDLVVSNPPYVADGEIERLEPEVRDHDPLVAVKAGRDGLDLVRIVEASARRLVRDGGLVAIEHSDRQGQTAPAVLAATGAWVEIEAHQDQFGRDRFVTARRAARRGDSRG